MNVVRKVLLGSAFFIFALQSLASGLCPAPTTHESATVRSVIDGDTVILNDGRHVRILGIDTPEVDHKTPSHSEPFALQAKTYLQKLLPPQTQIQLAFDTVRFDPHQRTLAHIMLSDGRNAAAQLLQQGLATQLLIPPNTMSWSCYQRIETQARKQHLGIWSAKPRQTLRAKDLSSDENQYRIVQGIVTDVSMSRRYLWLVLDHVLWVGIARDDLSYFPATFTKQLLNTTQEVRGWVYQSHGKLRMKIRHPQAIRPIG